MSYLIVKSNVNFKKLANNYKEAVDKALENIADDSSDKTRNNLNKSKSILGGTLDPLAEKTIEARKRGIYWEGSGTGRRGEDFKPTQRTGIKNVGGSKPLIYSGNLINSIQSNKNKMNFAGYGKKHHEGYDVKGNVKQWQVPSRPFIQSDIKDKTKKKFVEDLEKKLKK